MTLEELLELAHTIELGGYSRGPDALDLSRAVLSLLAESAPCGLEAPDSSGGFVRVPESWVDAVSPDDARAMARLLLQAADSADAKGKG